MSLSELVGRAEAKVHFSDTWQRDLQTLITLVGQPPGTVAVRDLACGLLLNVTRAPLWHLPCMHFVPLPVVASQVVWNFMTLNPRHSPDKARTF